MKLGITGSRTNTTFDFTELFCRKNKDFNAFLGRRRITSIITGGARGIDRQAELCAGKLKIPCRVIHPDYARYHKGAPLKRNLQIIAESDALLVVWNGNPNSPGTVFTAQHALKAGKSVFVILSADNKSYRIIGKIDDMRQFQTSSKTSENSCSDLKMERFRRLLVE